MNVVVLMSGDSRLFAEAGYVYPKSLIEIAGRPMIEHVLTSYAPLAELGARFTFVVRSEESSRYHLAAILRLMMPEATVIESPKPTGGAACSALLAVDVIDSEDELVLCNGDQVIEVDLNSVVTGFRGRGLDGGILVFDAVHPRWSFVKVDAEGQVIEASEKRPISRLATAGFYWFRRGADFVAAAQSMIMKEASVNGAFYVCPSYNEMILSQARIGICRMEAGRYHSLANPSSMQDFENYLRRRS